MCQLLDSIQFNVGGVPYEVSYVSSDLGPVYERLACAKTGANRCES